MRTRTGRVGEPETPDSPKESYQLTLFLSGASGRAHSNGCSRRASRGVKGRLARLLHRDCARTKTDMLAKYDANKDGKLDKKEKAKMSQEDKGAWAKAFPAKKKKGGEDAAASKADGDK